MFRPRLFPGSNQRPACSGTRKQAASPAAHSRGVGGFGMSKPLRRAVNTAASSGARSPTGAARLLERSAPSCLAPPAWAREPWRGAFAAPGISATRQSHLEIGSGAVLLVEQTIDLQPGAEPSPTSVGWWVEIRVTVAMRWRCSGRSSRRRSAPATGPCGRCRRQRNVNRLEQAVVKRHQGQRVVVPPNLEACQPRRRWSQADRGEVVAPRANPQRSPRRRVSRQRGNRGAAMVAVALPGQTVVVAATASGHVAGAVGNTFAVPPVIVWRTRCRHAHLPGRGSRHAAWPASRAPWTSQPEPGRNSVCSSPRNAGGWNCQPLFGNFVVSASFFNGGSQSSVRIMGVTAGDRRCPC